MAKAKTLATYATLYRAHWELVLKHLGSFPEAAQRIQETLDATNENIVAVHGSREGWKRVKGLIEGDDVLRDVAKILGWQLYAASMPDF